MTRTGATLTAALVLVSATHIALGRQSSSPSSSALLSVAVVQPERQSIDRELVLPGSVQADEETDLFSKASGYVASVKVDIGSRVRRGDPLVVLDVPEMMDELKQVESILASKRSKVDALRARAPLAEGQIKIARFEAARARAEADLREITLERTQELFRGAAIPEQQLDEARRHWAVAQAARDASSAQVARAESNRRLAQAELAVGRSEVVVAEANLSKIKTLMKYATIVAPFDGVITQRKVDTGAFVRSAAEGTTTALLRIAKVDRLRLVLAIPESAVASVRPGTEVRIEVPNLPGIVIEGVIARTAFALDPATRTMRAEVDLPNEKNRLQPGMYARARVQIGTGQAASTIPSRAIRVKDNATFVLVVRDGIAQNTPVKIGYDDGIVSEVVDGLRGDEWIITSATSAVTSGVRVTPVPTDAR